MHIHMQSIRPYLVGYRSLTWNKSGLSIGIEETSMSMGLRQQIIPHPTDRKLSWQKASRTVRFSKVKILSTLGTENKWNLKLLSCIPYILLGQFLYIPPNISFLSVFGKKDWFWVEVYAWNHSRLMMTLLGHKTVKPDRMSWGFYLELL